jgi:tRNA threonylcarbamoyladenosine biosynthesis protein TsaB
MMGETSAMGKTGVPATVPVEPDGLAGLADPVVLAVDTSTAHPGLAVTRGSQLLSLLVSSRVEPHSRALFELLTRLLDQAALSIEQIDLFAVVAGPGSFTGLRVGMAAMKGLAATHRQPLYGLNLLDLKALSLGVAASVLVVCEAGRGEVFAGWRRLTRAGQIESDPARDRYGPAATVLPALLAELEAAPDARPRFITGSGISLARPILEQLHRDQGFRLTTPIIADPSSPDWQLLPDPEPIAFTLARRVAQLARPGTSGQPEVPPSCHPVYIRPSDAELNWKP